MRWWREADVSILWADDVRRSTWTADLVQALRRCVWRLRAAVPRGGAGARGSQPRWGMIALGGFLTVGLAFWLLLTTGPVLQTGM